MIKRIGVLLFDGFDLLDLAGPSEVFSVAKELGSIDYQITLIGQSQKSYQSESGIKVIADMSIKNNIVFDTLIIPGGKGARDTQIISVHNPWLARQLKQCRRVVSICTGSYLLASTGILDHKKATTHWNYLQNFSELYPKIEVVEDQLYVDHGNIATSAGISSGIDLALALIESDCGTDLALRTSKFLVLHYRRTGSQAQFSEPLKYQFSSDAHFSNLTSWILQNMTDDLSITALAKQVNMTERSFYRNFSEQMKISPGKYVEKLRLEHAKTLLTDSNCPIQKVALACGYKNIDVFRRAFERKYSTSPNVFRSQFSLM